MTFQPVESYTRVRLSDVVSDQIKSLISAGKLLPGQKRCRPSASSPRS